MNSCYYHKNPYLAVLLAPARLLAVQKGNAIGFCCYSSEFSDQCSAGRRVGSVACLVNSILTSAVLCVVTSLRHVVVQYN